MNEANSTSSIDAVLPPEMARIAEQAGVKKAKLSLSQTFVLAVLAGAFIAMGAVFATTVTVGASGQLSYGVTKLLGGFAFTLGLILVVVAGAELFTGNNLIVMAWASGKVSTRQVLRNWLIVYIGNFGGALATAGLMLFSRQYEFSGGAIGESILKLASAKCQLGFVQAVALGMGCNALVCLAVWLCYSARTTTDKILSIIPPITAFVAIGFEHCVANMYFIPIGLFIKQSAAESFWGMIGTSPNAFSQLTWTNCFYANLLPVTIGNMLGGAIMVGAVYWYVYCRTTAEK